MGPRLARGRLPLRPSLRRLEAARGREPFRCTVVLMRLLASERLFAELHTFESIIDTRSPTEFALDRIPGAINCPVLDDAQRAEIGTLYRQVSPFEARRRGAALVARNIAWHLETTLADRPRHWRALVYCWRGGQRSAAMTHVLAQIGWQATQLEHGYQGFRRQVVQQLDTLAGRFDYRVLCGPTGSGKTALLRALAKHQQVLDLEALACHRGSLLGALLETPQPSQKAFETALWCALAQFDAARPVFTESEGARLGRLRVPMSLLSALRQSPCIRITTPLAERVAHLLQEYPAWCAAPKALSRQLWALLGMQSKATLCQWQRLIDDRRWPDLVHCLLVQHYDPAYSRSLAREFAAIGTAQQIDLPHTDAQTLDTVAKSMVGMLNAPRTSPPEKVVQVAP